MYTIAKIRAGVEEIWSKDIDEAFMEALVLYSKYEKNQKIRGLDGKFYGRPKLIASYIQQKTGKIRTPRQISSHIQVIFDKIAKKSMERKIPSILTVKFMIVPKIFQFFIQPKNHGFLDMVYYENANFLEVLSSRLLSVECLSEIIHLKTISSEKLTYLHSIGLSMDKNLNTSIVVGSTCAVPYVLDTISISRIKNFYDSTLIDFFNCSFIPQNRFYFVKNRLNLTHFEFDLLNGNCLVDETFASPFKMDIDITSVGYVNGQPLYNKMVEEVSRVEIFMNSNYFYIYRIQRQWTDSFKKFIFKR